MKKEIKIETVKLTIGEQKHELTIEEMRELQYVLGEFFKKEKEYITIPQTPDYHPTYPQVVPYWYKFTGDDPWDHQIYCSSNIKLEL